MKDYRHFTNKNIALEGSLIPPHHRALLQKSWDLNSGLSDSQPNLYSWRLRAPRQIIFSRKVMTTFLISHAPPPKAESSSLPLECGSGFTTALLDIVQWKRPCMTSAAPSSEVIDTAFTGPLCLGCSPWERGYHVVREPRPQGEATCRRCG